ncbi:MAG TPA: LacI family DNA-binding transcriptional regulator [Ignavibacteriaceae bacterium]|nr:LacI family DNA-binding transcriptional regulator [Ignavibacteriaceae bacterium]
MEKSIHITLDDIAKKLNVSKVTVSKALRGHPDISKETTLLVKKIAEELGYTPNYMARNLSSRHSNTIGVVVPKIAHFFFSAVIESIYDAAFNNNYEIILTVSQESAEREKKHIESLLAMRVDGLIVSITQQTRDLAIFEKVKRQGIPLTFIDRILDIPNTSSVTVDDRGGAFQAIEHAIKLGYTKIGHLAGFHEINIGLKRYQGFEDAMKQYGLDINPDWVIHGSFGEEAGYRGFMQMYNNNNLPEFIFTVTYPVALGVYAAVQEVGLKIPDDIDIMCFGNSDVNRFISPSLSCVNQPTELLGKKAVEVTLEHIKNIDSFEPQHIEIPTELLLRETCSGKGKISFFKTASNAIY